MLAPDVGTLFEYGLDGFRRSPAKFRVTGWMRVRQVLPDVVDMAESGALPDEYGGRIHLAIHEANRRFRASLGSKGVELEFCMREQATHVSGAGICGCTAPIAEIKVTGKVSWSEEMVQEERRQAIALARSDALDAAMKQGPFVALGVPAVPDEAHDEHIERCDAPRAS